MTLDNELQMKIDGIALKQETSEINNWLPNVKGHPQHPPYTHQVQMRDLIENKDKFIAINTTITGGGKTQSYSVPVLNNDLFTIVVFPTNALTTDQKQSIEELCNNYYSDKDTFIKQLTGDEMQRYREEQRKKGNLSKASLTNSEQIRKSLINAERNDGPSFILTNPDVLVGMLNEFYGSAVRQHLKAADMMVIDEFHHAQPKGKNTLICKMDELYYDIDEKCNLKKFVFLSATPDESLEKQLKNKFGLPEDDNIYHHINSKDKCKSLSQLSDKEPFNPVMPIVDTTVIGGRAFSTKEKILSEEYFERVLRFIESGNRSIVILDGVAEVNDVHHALQNNLKNMSVDKISGLTSEDTHHKLQNSDVLVANSTLEVGVDIGNVEQLIFTGFNASSFMQRLGRLRAEPGLSFKSAMCFTKPDTVESFKVFNEFDSDYVQRKMLHDTVKRKLDTTADINVYRSEFTPIELYYSIRNIKENMHENADDYERKMNQIIIKHCYETVEYDIRKEDVERLYKMSLTPLGEAMQSYRQSSLTALLYDARTKTVKTYSIPSLLRFGNVEFLTEKEFDFHLKNRAGITDPSLYDSEKQYVQAYAWLNGYKSGEKLRNPHMAPTNQIQNMIAENPKNRYPELIKSVEFTVEDTSELTGLNKLNRVLNHKLRGQSGTNLIGYATEGHPAQIQTIYGLDEFFFTNPIANMNGEYTMAIGENAQYLYCHVQENISTAEKLHKQLKY